MVENDLNDPIQSAYRTYHSTETTLVKVHNDLSATFDTVDHEILLLRLEKRLGVVQLKYGSSLILAVAHKECISREHHQMLVLLGMVSTKVQSLEPNCSRYTLFLLEISLRTMIDNIKYMQMVTICILLLNHRLLRTLTHSIELWLTLNPVYWTLAHGCPPMFSN